MSQVLVDKCVILVLVIQPSHHVILEMLEQEHLVVELSRIIIDGVVGPKSMKGSPLSGRVDMIEVSGGSVSLQLIR